MDNLSPKQMRHIGSLYESIYQAQQENIEDITEEDFYSILAIKICNALIEEGLMEGEVITETTIMEGRLKTAWNAVMSVAKPVIKQVTGFGTKPTTALGTKVRLGQKVGTGALAGASISNPEVPQRILNTAIGTVTGAVKGAYQGATQPISGPNIVDRIKAFQNPPKRAPIK